ncbi:MAG: HAMP domain-containing sensor histidine kinase [Actinobacteria bacterium]|nr:HAMP domain-containing sensor histidine kinase [Actinomycetota bacterium]
MSAVPGATEPTGKTAIVTEPRRWAATFTVAAIVAAIACAVPVSAAFLLMSARAGGFFFGYGAYADLIVAGSLLFALAGLAAAVIIAIVATRSRSHASSAAGQAPVHERSHRAGLLWIAAAVAAFSAVVFVLIWGTAFGQTESDLILYAVEVAALVGLVVAAVLAVRAIWPGRPTSLRTRAFFVIAVAVLIPSFCLALLGVWAYYRSWDTATSLYSGQASYQASEIASEIASVQKQRARFGPNERARLAAAIAAAYGAQGHFEGAQLATLSQLRETRTLPVWALRSLARHGYAIGGQHVQPGSPDADTVAWRVGPQTVRYYVPQWTGGAFFSAPTPVDRLLWIAVLGVALIVAVGLLGAWLLTRGVVRPVRRLAEASGRLAEGEAGVTVRPEGPRELRELATSFNDMNTRLTKAQETEQAFLLSVSHELKTPLTSIRGYAEGIGDGTVKPPEGAEVIGAESSRLERLVGDLLDSGRMRKSAFTVRREEVDLAALAQDVARRYEGTARDAGLTLLRNTDAGGSAVADNDRLLQVVSNLVENAIRCTPAPGTVTITTQPGVVSIADTGRGLTSDDLPRAFERFYLYSRYGTDRPVGTGLGLAIVKDLTEAMGGTVSVSSAVGVGTAFTVVLPQDVMLSTVALPRDDESPTVALPQDDAS